MILRRAMLASPACGVPQRGVGRRASSLAPLIAALLLALVLLPGGGAAAVDDRTSIFGSAAVRSDNLRLFPMWRGALARYFHERQVSETCSPSLFDRCDLEEWEAFLEDQKGRDPLAQLEAVNRHMNKHRYITDPRNWGVEDYWATPLQFFRKNGDCEDYAIAKFMSLRALGWDNEALRIVVVNDMNLRVQHAVLVVFLDDGAYVLDNQSPSVMRQDRIRHYRPVYSVNETSWWMHRS